MALMVAMPSIPISCEAIESGKWPSATGSPAVTARDSSSVAPDSTGKSTEFKIEEHAVDSVRPIKVGIIGAGISGITAGALLPAKVPGLDLRIYDKNSGLGGTWFENTYPGVRCDVPAHVYQSTFSPNIRWTEEFAQGKEIREYWEQLAKAYNVSQYVHLNQQVQKAEWLNDEGRWKVTVQPLEASEDIYEEKLDILINAIGRFNAWKLPDYHGIQNFKGRIFHSSNWQHNVELVGKRIALIGNGASGLQVLPSIQPLARHIDHYARNPTWIADPAANKDLGVRRLEPNSFSDDQLDRFKDPGKYLEYRKLVENNYFQGFASIFRDSPQNKEQSEKWTKAMKRRVAGKPELQDHILPDFPPNCRRPTPGPGYLEALAKDNVTYIPTMIKRFTEEDIVTEDGDEREVDVVICCTGANTDHAPPFSIVANDIDLKSAWKKNGHFGFPYSYLGLATPGFPNLFWLGGPYASSQAGTTVNSLENTVTYIAKVLRKVRSQDIRTIVPSKEATDDFVEYSDAFFPRTVWSANCSSWYNGGNPGARIFGLFPGSAAAANYIRRDPRWEDYEYTHVSPSGNRFAYFGNGWTSREQDPDADLTLHLGRHDEVDLRTFMEGWWDV